jgi:4-hydroxybenzoate polyprenyltransferase
MNTFLKVQQRLPIIKVQNELQDNIVCLHSVNCVILFYFYIMQSKLKRQKLILVSILLMIAFTYPIISIANRSHLVAGIPVLFLYIFIVWIIAIIVLYRLADAKQKKADE